VNRFRLVMPFGMQPYAVAASVILLLTCTLAVWMGQLLPPTALVGTVQQAPAHPRAPPRADSRRRRSGQRKQRALRYCRLRRIAPPGRGSRRVAGHAPESGLLSTVDHSRKPPKIPGGISAEKQCRAEKAGHDRRQSRRAHGDGRRTAAGAPSGNGPGHFAGGCAAR
jgi:hypothetical protein